MLFSFWSFLQMLLWLLLKMNEDRQMELHYMDTGFPYTNTESFMDFFQGLHQHQVPAYGNAVPLLDQVTERVMKNWCNLFVNARARVLSFERIILEMHGDLFLREMLTGQWICNVTNLEYLIMGIRITAIRRKVTIYHLQWMLVKGNGSILLQRWMSKSPNHPMRHPWRKML